MHGPHLMLDCHGCDKQKIRDMNLVFDFLDKLPAQIGMTKMTLPYTVWWPGGTPNDDGGISGFVLIAESHISIHTFPELGYFTFDLYSCKAFDRKKVIEIIKQYFGPTRVMEEFVHRGKLFVESKATAVPRPRRAMARA
ncbi:adenosylmethionine decarboxylase [Candidatus Micrarchaeota archaeon]|nr:adenosylmethionine decarboxylase [Candidatus Micrarchaeota archaeon]